VLSRSYESLAAEMNRVKEAYEKPNYFLFFRGEEVLTAFKTEDYPTLSTLVHPEKGVRFSPFSQVNLKTDIVFRAEEIKNMAGNTTVYEWGKYNSGKPIKMTFSEYVKALVYDKEYLAGKQHIHEPTMDDMNNYAEVYPRSVTVSYEYSGSKEKQYLDWKVLILVFEQKDGNWYLVGVIQMHGWQDPIHDM
jgi:hypothetical protein